MAALLEHVAVAVIVVTQGSGLQLLVAEATHATEGTRLTALAARIALPAGDETALSGRQIRSGEEALDEAVLAAHGASALAGLAQLRALVADGAVGSPRGFRARGALTVAEGLEATVIFLTTRHRRTLYAAPLGTTRRVRWAALRSGSQLARFVRPTLPRVAATVGAFAVVVAAVALFTRLAHLVAAKRTTWLRKRCTSNEIPVMPSKSVLLKISVAAAACVPTIVVTASSALSRSPPSSFRYDSNSKWSTTTSTLQTRLSNMPDRRFEPPAPVGSGDSVEARGTEDSFQDSLAIAAVEGVPWASTSGSVMERFRLILP